MHVSDEFAVIRGELYDVNLPEGLAMSITPINKLEVEVEVEIDATHPISLDGMGRDEN